MILPHSTYDEIFDALCRESEKANYRLERFADRTQREYRDLLRSVRTAPRLPFVRSAVDVLPDSGNRYLQWCVIQKSGQDYYDSHLVQTSRHGERHYWSLHRVSFYQTDSKSQQWQYILSCETPHVLKRFRERTPSLKDVSAEELLAFFRIRCEHMALLRHYDKISSRTNNGTYAAIQIEGGLLYATVLEQKTPGGTPYTVQILNTYIPQSMLKNNQVNNMGDDTFFRRIREEGFEDTIKKLF